MNPTTALPTALPDNKSSLRLALLAGLAVSLAHTCAAAEIIDLAKYTFSQNTLLASEANAEHVDAANWTPGEAFTASYADRFGASTWSWDYFIRGDAPLNSNGTEGGGTEVASEAEARTYGSYLAFNITVEGGWTASLAQFSATISAQQGAGVTTTWQLAVSTDGQNFINTGSVCSITLSDSSRVDVPMTVNLADSAYASVTGATLYFRLYEWDTSNEFGYVTRIDNVILTGSVSVAAVPEASTWACFLGMSGLAMTVAMRFFRKGKPEVNQG
jgi:hypothetical protein